MVMTFHVKLSTWLFGPQTAPWSSSFQPRDLRAAAFPKESARIAHGKAKPHSLLTHQIAHRIEPQHPARERKRSC